MSGNSFRGDSNPNRIWPRPSRPLTLSDITGPSVSNLLDSSKIQEADKQNEAKPKDVQLYSQQKHLHLPTEGNDTCLREGNADSHTLLPLQRNEIPGTSFKPEEMQYNASMQNYSQHHGVRMTAPCQAMPSVLMDHDFGYPANLGRDYGSYSSTQTDGGTEKKTASMEGHANDGKGPINAMEEVKEKVSVKERSEVGAEGSQMDMGDCPANADEEVYCICRTSDTERFMIGCDKCTEWYHGDCINLRKSEAKNVKEWYCQMCLDAYPDLEIKYKAIKHEDQSHQKKGKRISRMCGECIACKQSHDCGDCDFCQDMKKFGGEGRLRQKCRLRQCLKLSKIIQKKPGRFIFPDEYIQEYKQLFEERSKDYDRRAHGENNQWTTEGSVDRRKAVKVKHAKQTHFNKQKKRKEKELRDLMKKEIREMKMSKLQRKKEERAKRRITVDPKSRKRYSGGKEDYASSKRTDSKKEEPRHCLGPGCINAAINGSKYCSDECGVQLALRRLQEILPERSKIWKDSPSIATEKGAKLIEEIHKQQEVCKQRLLDLDKEQAEFEAIVEKSKQLTICEEEENDDVEGDIDLTVYCVTCGLPLAPKIALRHMEKCYSKLECHTSFGAAYRSAGNLFCDTYNVQQRSYCKRLRVLCPEHTKDRKIGVDEVCGCPLNERRGKEATEFCRAPKRKCTKHYYWDKLRRAEIDLKRLHEWWRLEEGLEQERAIEKSINCRGGVVGILLHQTIDHTKTTLKAEKLGY